MIIKNTYVLIIFLFLSITAFGQNEDMSETKIAQLEYSSVQGMEWNSPPASAIGSNTSHLSQYGSKNLIEVNQTQTNPNSANNFAGILQAGSENSAKLSQNGSNNKAVWAQIGHANEYEASFEGDNNYSMLVQFGSFNVVQQDITGNDLDYRVEQYGNNNEFIQVENNGFSKPLSIIQRGNGITIKTYNGGFVR